MWHRSIKQHFDALSAIGGMTHFFHEARALLVSILAAFFINT